MFEDSELEELAAIYVISAAAELAGMHPQTLRQYDRMGLVSPQRTSGRGRRYSRSDVEALREIQRLSQEEGVNLAGIKHIMALQRQISQLRAENKKLRAALNQLENRSGRIYAVSTQGAVSPVTAHVNRRSRTTTTDVVRYSQSRQIVRWHSE